MAGVVGFEPTYDGFRDRCLTAWRYPIKTIITQNPKIAIYLRINIPLIFENYFFLSNKERFNL